MKMFQLIEWFQIHFPKMHNDLLECNHNFDEKNLNPYHLESDCWSHTMMVCKVAELSMYDKVVQVAALLHDIGKPASRKINPRNNHVQFFGHEVLSVEMAEEVLDLMIEKAFITEDEKLEIIKLVLHHGFLHKCADLNSIVTHFENNWVFCKHLVQLSRCDSLGRFSADNFDEVKHKLLLEIIHNAKK